MYKIFLPLLVIALFGGSILARPTPAYAAVGFCWTFWNCSSTTAAPKNSPTPQTQTLPQSSGTQPQTQPQSTPTQPQSAPVGDCGTVPDQYQGQATCVSNYNTCIQNHPNGASQCAQYSAQIGQSQFASNDCANNPSRYPTGQDCSALDNVPANFIDYINHPDPTPVPIPQSKPTPPPTQFQAGCYNNGPQLVYEGPAVNGSCPDGTSYVGANGRELDLGYTPLEPLPVAGGSGTLSDYSDFAAYLNYLFPILIVIGALFGVGKLAISGFTYMFSSVPGVKARSLENVFASLWGLVLLIGVVVILQTINPALTHFDLSSLRNIGSQ